MHCAVTQNWNEFLLVVIVKATAVKQQISKNYLQIQPTDGSDHVYASQWPVINARRPASADRTARRQFQAAGQPVSRTQAIDAMTSRLPPYEARCVQRRCFQCRPVTLCSDIKGTELSLPIYWYHSKGNWLRYNFAADSFYIMKLCSRLFFLYCRNCPNNHKF